MPCRILLLRNRVGRTVFFVSGGCRKGDTDMTIAHVNLSYQHNGGTMVVQFSFERAAIAYAREIGLKSYKITCGSAVLVSV